MWRRAAFGLALFTICPAGAGGFPFDAFERHTFAEIMAEEAGHEADMNPAKPGDLILHPAVRAKVQAQFTGMHRPLDAARKKDISNWATAYRAQDGWAASFADEYLFKAEGQEWWLPVQSQVAEFFSKELKPEAAVNLYLIYGGATRDQNGWRVLFFVEEFRADK